MLVQRCALRGIQEEGVGRRRGRAALRPALRGTAPGVTSCHLNRRNRLVWRRPFAPSASSSGFFMPAGSQEGSVARLVDREDRTWRCWQNAFVPLEIEAPRLTL